MIQKIKSKIIEKSDLSKDVKKFILGVPKEFKFKPGQYILLELKIDGNVQRRAYSIASSPDKNKIELCIKKVKEKGFVSELFKLKEGSEINFMGPAGKFVIDEKPNNNLVFISVGTGIAPFKSMIEYLLKNLNFKKQITLIHGYRHKENILYKKFFQDLEKSFPNFEQNIVLSKPKTISEKIHKGHVQDLIKDLIKNPDENNFYICGMKEMVVSVNKELNNLKVRENIFFENY
jgi:ferredoxin-NADP reductase